MSHANMRIFLGVLAAACLMGRTPASAVEIPPALYAGTGIPCRVAPELLGVTGPALDFSHYVAAGEAAAGLTGAYLFDFGNGRSDAISIRRNVADEVMEIAFGPGRDIGFAMSEAEFTFVFCKCFRFVGLEPEDRVSVAGFDRGYVARSLRIPYESLADAHIGGPGKRAAVREIEALTAAGAFGVRLDESVIADGEGDDAWLEAARNSVAVHVNAAAFANVMSGAKVRADSRHVVPVGGGTLVRVADRLVVVTAAHILPRGHRRHGLSVVAADGSVYAVRPIIRSDLATDLAVLAFSERADEEEAIGRFGGLGLATEPVRAGEFVFHFGFPESWRDADRRPGAGAEGPVLTSGIVDRMEPTVVRASLRIGRGNSGGGLFVLADDGTPALIGPASTMRTRHGDGNPPEGEALGPVTGRFLALHPYRLDRVLAH